MSSLSAVSADQSTHTTEAGKSVWDNRKGYKQASIGLTFSREDLRSDETIARIKEALHQSKSGEISVSLDLERPSPLSRHDQIERLVRGVSLNEVFYMSSGIPDNDDFDSYTRFLSGHGIDVKSVLPGRDVWCMGDNFSLLSAFNIRDRIFNPASVHLKLCSQELTPDQQGYLARQAEFYAKHDQTKYAFDVAEQGYEIKSDGAFKPR